MILCQLEVIRHEKQDNRAKYLLRGTCAALAVPLSYGLVSRSVLADIKESSDSETQTEIAIDAAHFPDEEFRKAVKQLDLDKNGVLSETEQNAGYIDLESKGIRSVKGIENFPNLMYLDCMYNELEELDISKNTIVRLNCDGNQLTSLDISHNPDLETLVCCNNKIKTLDCSNNPRLITLDCAGELEGNDDEIGLGTLTSLNIKGCRWLQTLYCYGNKLASLDLSTNSQLTSLFCQTNQLTKLDVSNLEFLEKLVCGHNKLTELDVSNNENLCELCFEDNQISSIDLSKNGILTVLNCENNNLTSLDVSEMYELQILTTHGNKFESLDIGNTKIVDFYKESELEDMGTYYTFLYPYVDEETGEELMILLTFDKATKLNVERDNEIICSIDEKTFPDASFRQFVSNKLDLNHDKKLSKVEIGKVKSIRIGYEKGEKTEDMKSIQGVEVFTSLELLSINGTQLEKIALGQMDSLKDFAYLGSQSGKDIGPLKKLDLSRCKNLKSMLLDNTDLKDLDLSKIGSLESLHISLLPLKYLDLSANTQLQSLYVDTCSDLDEVKFGKNSALQYVTILVSGISKLNLSQCANLLNLTCHQTNLSSLDVSKNTKLETLSVIMCKISKIDISKNTKLMGISFDETKIESIDLSQNHELKYLSMWESDLKSIDLSHNPLLTDLDVSATKLAELDVSNCHALETLCCSGDEISELNVSNNPNLQNVFCGSSKFTKLDFSHCPQLQVLECGGNEILTELNLKNTMIDNLDCCGTSIEKLDLSDLDLHILRCSKTKIKDLDLSSQTNLGELVASGLGLTRIDLSKLENLNQLDLSDNLLTSLILNENVKLWSVDLRFNMFDKSPEITCEGEYLFAPQKYAPQVKGLKLVSRDDKAVTISWDETHGIHGYEIFRSEKEDGDFTGIGTLTVTDLTFRDETAEAGKEYFYYVCAYIDLEPDYNLGIWYGEPSDKLKVEAVNVAPPPTFEGFVERLYTEALGRESDKEGKEYWVNQVVDGGKTGADCARFFLLDAPEFMNRNLSNEDFVETLYKTFFDREADAAGKKGWVDSISSGAKSRAEVVNDFIESTEWCDVCATYGVKSGSKYHKSTKASKNATNFATRLYTCCLKRDAEEGGLQYWSLALTNLEQTGASAAQFFFESDEFRGFNTTDKEYLIRLYTTFMDREPDKSEISYWRGEMAEGRQDRHSVLAFFAQSEEFTGICKQYGIDRGTIA